MGGKQKGIKGWQAGHTKARETQAKAAIKGWQAGHTKAQETQAKAAIRDFCARQGDGQGHQKLASRALKQALWPLQAAHTTLCQGISTPADCAKPHPRQRTVPSHIHVSGLCQAISTSADCAKAAPPTSPNPETSQGCTCIFVGVRACASVRECRPKPATHTPDGKYSSRLLLSQLLSTTSTASWYSWPPMKT